MTDPPLIRRIVFDHIHLFFIEFAFLPDWLTIYIKNGLAPRWIDLCHQSGENNRIFLLTKNRRFKACNNRCLTNVVFPAVK